MRSDVTLLAMLAAVSMSAVARADPPAQGPTYTTHVVDIVGRRVQPIAAIDVARVLPSIKLHELKPSFVLGVEASVGDRPF